MGKAARNRAIRKQARAAKDSHPSDPRDTTGIARAIRRHGRVSGGKMDEYGIPVHYQPKMSTIKGKK